MANWFITGVSSGFGRALAEAVLAKGHKVIGTVRQEAAKAPFEALSPGRATAVVLDVTDEADVHTVVDEVLEHHGRIDVLVNNAGYGLEGAVEEVSLDQVRDQFEVNVFGPVAVMQAVLPHMRKQRSGHIINVTSMGGLTAFPGVGIYNGSKFALVGLSEGLRSEVLRDGIFVTTVCSSFEIIVIDMPVISIFSRSLKSGQRAKSRSNSPMRTDSAFLVSEAITGTATRD